MNKAILELTVRLWETFLIIFAAFFLIVMKNLIAAFIVGLTYAIFSWLADHPELLTRQLGKKREQKPEQEAKVKLW